MARSISLSCLPLSTTSFGVRDLAIPRYFITNRRGMSIGKGRIGLFGRRPGICVVPIVK